MSPVSLDWIKGTDYVAAMRTPTTDRSAEVPATDGKPAVRCVTLDTASDEKRGTLSAIDLKASGFRHGGAVIVFGLADD